jgi:hypothetical protein
LFEPGFILAKSINKGWKWFEGNLLPNVTPFTSFVIGFYMKLVVRPVFWGITFIQFKRKDMAPGPSF